MSNNTICQFHDERKKKQPNGNRIQLNRTKNLPRAKKRRVMRLLDLRRFYRQKNENEYTNPDRKSTKKKKEIE